MPEPRGCPAATWRHAQQSDGTLIALDVVRCTFLTGHTGPHADGDGLVWADWSPESAGYVEAVRRG